MVVAMGCKSQKIMKKALGWQGGWVGWFAESQNAQLTADLPLN